MRILKNTLKNTLKIEKKQESEDNKLSAILSSMREGLVMFDQRSRVILMNQAAGILLRVAPAEAIEQNIHTLFLLFQGKKRIEEKNSPIKTAIRVARTAFEAAHPGTSMDEENAGDVIRWLREQGAESEEPES